MMTISEYYYVLCDYWKDILKTDQDYDNYAIQCRMTYPIIKIYYESLGIPFTKETLIERLDKARKLKEDKRI